MENVIELPVTSYSERVREVSESNLNAIVKRGAAQASAVIDHVLGERPRDALVKTTALDFRLRDGVQLQATTKNGNAWSFHDHALGQLSDRIEAPRKYVRDLREGALHGAPEWQRNLLVDILREHCVSESKSLLFRDIDGQARGVLSSSYKRLRAAPLVETFFEMAKELRAVPSGGFYNDVRFMLRVIYPMALRISDTETVCLGAQLKTSDYGAGVFEIDPFAFRSTCLNTAQFNPALSYKHLGARISDDVVVSERTVDLDTQHLQSASRDVIRGVFSESSKAQIVKSLQAANETDTSYSKHKSRIERALGKGLAAKVEEAFEGADVINLPPEKTVYRLSNALTFVAQHMDNADTADAAERLAGSLLAA